MFARDTVLQDAAATHARFMILPWVRGSGESCSLRYFAYYFASTRIPFREFPIADTVTYAPFGLVQYVPSIWLELLRRGV